MNPFIWCAVGAVAGCIAGGPMAAVGLSRVENVLVGVFGAFIGGEFLASFTGGGSSGFRVSSLALAVGGAVVLLVLLALLRRVVGPLQSRSRKKSRP